MLSTLQKRKVALITGAASGIGKATALEYSRQGWGVVISDRDEQGGRETLRLVEAQGGFGVWIYCDTSESSSVHALFQEVQEKLGRLDAAFNNAGVEGQQAELDQDLEVNWDQVISVNLKGVWLCMKQEIAMMKLQRSGVIINCSSIAGLVGFRGSSAYTASKHGVIGLTRAAALEYAPHGIRINAICPGVILTPMIERFTHGDQNLLQSLISPVPLGRIGQPEEIARAVVWMSSDQASYLIAHALVVDGGWVAQ